MTSIELNWQGETKLQMLFDDVIRYILLRSRWIESDMRLEPRYGADFSRWVKKAAIIGR